MFGSPRNFQACSLPKYMYYMYICTWKCLDGDLFIVLSHTNNTNTNANATASNTNMNTTNEHKTICAWHISAFCKKCRCIETIFNNTRFSTLMLEIDAERPTLLSAYSSIHIYVDILCAEYTLYTVYTVCSWRPQVQRFSALGGKSHSHLLDMAGWRDVRP